MTATNDLMAGLVSAKNDEERRRYTYSIEAAISECCWGRKDKECRSCEEARKLIRAPWLVRCTGSFYSQQTVRKSSTTGFSVSFFLYPSWHSAAEDTNMDVGSGLWMPLKASFEWAQLSVVSGDVDDIERFRKTTCFGVSFDYHGMPNVCVSIARIKRTSSTLVRKRWSPYAWRIGFVPTRAEAPNSCFCAAAFVAPPFVARDDLVLRADIGGVIWAPKTVAELKGWRLLA